MGEGGLGKSCPQRPACAHGGGGPTSIRVPHPPLWAAEVHVLQQGGLTIWLCPRKPRAVPSPGAASGDTGFSRPHSCFRMSRPGRARQPMPTRELLEETLGLHLHGLLPMTVGWRPPGAHRPFGEAPSPQAHRDTRHPALRGTWTPPSGRLLRPGLGPGKAMLSVARCDPSSFWLSGAPAQQPLGQPSPVLLPRRPGLIAPVPAAPPAPGPGPSLLPTLLVKPCRLTGRKH